MSYLKIKNSTISGSKLNSGWLLNEVSNSIVSNTVLSLNPIADFSGTKLKNVTVRMPGFTEAAGNTWRTHTHTHTLVSHS